MPSVKEYFFSALIIHASTIDPPDFSWFSFLLQRRTIHSLLDVISEDPKKLLFASFRRNEAWIAIPFPIRSRDDAAIIPLVFGDPQTERSLHPFTLLPLRPKLSSSLPRSYALIWKWSDQWHIIWFSIAAVRVAASSSRHSSVSHGLSILQVELIPSPLYTSPALHFQLC